MNQFEREIKSALDNYTPSHDGGAWEEMERRMASSESSKSMVSPFYKKFILAGVSLSLVFVGINMGVEQQGVHSDAIAEHHTTSIPVGHNEVETTINVDHSKVISTEDIISEEVILDEVTEITKANSVEEPVVVERVIVAPVKSTDNLSSQEKEGIVKINESIQKELRDKPVRVYLGKDFNLNASNLLTPDGDGYNDVFMPSALGHDDVFKLNVFGLNGDVIFSSISVDNTWNGVNDLTSEKVSAGKYRWKVTLTNNKRTEIFTGTVMVK